MSSQERAPGSYPGYDQFGRVVKQMWVDGGFDEHATSGGVPNVPPLVEIDYTYDKASNRTEVLDGRPGTAWPNRDARATMDDLHRLNLDVEMGVPSVALRAFRSL